MLSTPTPAAHAVPPSPPLAPEVPALSPVEALTSAVWDTVRLLFQPFAIGRWFKLTLICLFLGGGTPTAAFHWSLNSIPSEIWGNGIFARLRHYIGQNLGLIILLVVLALGLALAWLYLRCVFRFALVDALIRQEAFPGRAWATLRPQGQAYFFWLLAILGTLGLALSAAGLVALPIFQRGQPAAARSLLPSLFLIAGLATVVLAGLAVAVLITLTDDLVVPLMYAERTSFPAAWRKLGSRMRAEPGPFGIYVLLRFALAVGVSVVVLFFLFPILVAVFSATIMAAALVVLLLHVIGLAWVWNTFTVALALAALMLLSVLLLVLLSVVGMPGQVFLQNFGLRFVASRFSSLEFLRLYPGAPGEAR